GETRGEPVASEKDGRAVPRLGGRHASVRVPRRGTRERPASTERSPRRGRNDASDTARSPFFIQAEDGIRDFHETGVQTCALPIYKPILVAPAMNVRMWENPSTRANMALLESRGVRRVGPNAGPLAEDEVGMGRMAEPSEILAAIEDYFGTAAPLAGRRALVTSGPTYEAIDPVRFIGNRSSGKQGHAIAGGLARLGAATSLVSGPTAEADPPGVSVVRVESAAEMLQACEAALPVDVAICAAAVGDWRVKKLSAQKLKKNGAPPTLELAENPDILATLSAAGNRRPTLVVGFAAETENVVA